MRSAKRHVVHIGFHASEAHTIDFDADHVTAVMARGSRSRLPDELASRFARIALLDLPDSTDLETYDRAIDRMRELVDELAADFGPPDAIVALYEHTTLPAARLREHFEVSGTSVRTALLCRDKVPMKEALASAGVPVPRFLAVSPRTWNNELSDFVGQLPPGPIVLKPRSQGASIGVRILESGTELLALAAEGGIEEGYEVEEFVQGSIYHIDGVVRDGDLRWFCTSRYLDTCFNFQHGNQPLAAVSSDDPELTERMRTFTAQVLHALALTESTFHLELFHTPDDRLVFLEIGNRFGGAGISWHQRTVFGVDLAKEAVLACMGLPSEVATPRTMLDTPGHGASGWLYMPLDPDGPVRVLDVTGVDELPSTVLSADIPEVGDVLNGRGNVWRTGGRFLVGGSSEASVEESMGRIVDTYTVTTTAGD
ncbi:hypothetical protein JGS22_007420 [Streptomyces sp. P38-E01]|uniref:ATP-grasp domain-containing protein n=1 Tax=Streptomyces tardus TaxID=2780544 RepID=A0A949JJP9_9ACTN|nr:hypothetical protein [Streptomyces tardus]MBU7597459.1 hypothetical protein [Streptomyces tardus]